LRNLGAQGGKLLVAIVLASAQVVAQSKEEQGKGGSDDRW
jgi:hypothetical protein